MTVSQAIPAYAITGVILAGGLARRMGGVDKGLQRFRGHTLIEHTCHRLRPQVGAMGINANRFLDVHAAQGLPIWPDAHADFSGPLAGFLAGLTQCTTPYLLTVPCDTPFFPLDLAHRLGNGVIQAQADLAMAVAPETDAQGASTLRTQPVFCLLKTELRDSLARFLREGGRKIDAWTALHRTCTVSFNAPGDDPHAFLNINTLEQLHRLESTRS